MLELLPWGVVFLTVLFVYEVNGYPSGAPDWGIVCYDMSPGHNAAPQTTKPDYRITVLGSSGNPDRQTFNVTLDGGTFRGFLLEARIRSNGSIVGSFVSLSNLSRLICSGSGLTHTSRDEKTAMQTVWTPPANTGLQDVYFVATVVSNKTVFWTNITWAETAAAATTTSAPETVPVTTTTSAPDKQSSSPDVGHMTSESSSTASSTSFLPTPVSMTTSPGPVTQPSSPAVNLMTSEAYVETSSTVFAQLSTTSSTGDDIDTTWCGSTKTCFTDANCSLSSDTRNQSFGFVLTWADAGWAVSFEVSAEVEETDSWVAFGLSADDAMSQESVVVCVYNDQTRGVEIMSMTGDDFINRSVDDEDKHSGLVNGSLSGGVRNGRLFCRFQRLKYAMLNSTYPLLPLGGFNQYYIMMATGTASLGKMNDTDYQFLCDNRVNFTFSAVYAGGPINSGLGYRGFLVILAFAVLDKV